MQNSLKALSPGIVAPCPHGSDDKPSILGHNVSSELWKDVKGLEGCYQISSIGKVRSLDRVIKKGGNQCIECSQLFKGKILTNVLHKNGYYRVELRFKLYSVHRLVAEAFIPNPDNKPQVNHINAIKTDNRVENLEWCTAKENVSHSLLKGLRKPLKGKDHYLFGIKSKNHPQAKKVINLETGKEYSCLKDAAKEVDFEYKYLSLMLSGKANNKTSLVYA